jgi:hypothetical protein
MDARVMGERKRAIFERLSPRMTIRVSLRIVCEDIPRRNDRYAAIRR